MTTFMGMSCTLANSKSRWSWAGTAITAPAPYSYITKLPTYTGISLPVSGFIAYFPMNMPFLSLSAAIRWNLSSCCTSARNTSKSAWYFVPSTQSFIIGCSGANTMKVTPNTVSGRVVNIGMVSPVSTMLNLMMVPSLRPIQLRCIILTDSGQSRSSRPSSSSSA